jgi:Rrf2 family protein
MASKVLKALCRAHVVTSRRGMAGGYELARAPSEISMAEIIEALEGPVAMTECAAAGCVLESRCVVRGNWGLLSGAIQALLRGVSLQDMMHPAGVLQRTAATQRSAAGNGAVQ